MSGGHFKYKQYEIGSIANEVEYLIRNNTNEGLNDLGEKEGTFYNEDTIARFKQGLRYLKLAQIYAHRIDWLVSCDDGEDTFNRRIKSDIGELK
jgi:hypothetical protein